MSNVAASNFTSLYNSNASPIVPSMPYGNANVVSLLNVGTDGANTVGNIDAAGIISAAGNIATAAFFIGDGSRITNLPDGNYGNANVEALLATYTGPITGSTISAIGNITGSYFVGNGSLLTGIASSSTYGNANVAAFLPTYTGNIAGGNITVSGAVSGATVAGNGAALSSLTGANVTGTVANATFATNAGAATTAGTVTTAAQPNITSVGTMTSITSTGNITGNYFVGNGSLLTGIAAGYGNANVAAFLPTYTGVLAGSSLTATGNVTGGNVNTSGNVSGLYIKGDGSQLTNITASYGNDISVSGNIQAGGFIQSIGNATVGGILTTFGNAAINANLYVAGNITAPSSWVIAGNLQATDNIYGENGTYSQVLTAQSIVANTTVSATGNITGSYFVGNGSLLTGINSSTYGNANVAAFLPTYTGELTGGNITTPGAISATGAVTGQGGLFTSSQLIVGTSINAASITATGNIVGGNLRTAGQVTATGNITGNYFLGNGSQLTGTYGNANVAALLPGYGGNILANVITTNNITGVNLIETSVLYASGSIEVGVNPGGAGDGLSSTGYLIGNTITANLSITSSDTISATGNITGGNINTGGNVTGTYILGNGSLLTGIAATAAGGSPTQVQYARSDNTFGGAAPMTFNDSNGNIALGNIIFNPGNSASQINNIQDMSTSTGSNPGRILIGNGYNGNISNAMDFLPRTRGSRLAVWGSHTQGSESVQASGLVAQESVTLTANTNANLNSRSFAMSGILQLGGGVSAYNFQQPYTVALAAQGGLVVVGTSGNSAVGNTVVTALGGTVSGVQAQSGATIVNGVGFTAIGITAGGTITNFAAFAPFSSHVGGTAPTNYSILYNPPAGAGGNGVLNSNNWRAASNYWFLNNEDAAAQNRLGSLRSYTEFNYSNNGTSGGITISKNNGQVQQITPSGAITSLTYADFVASASDGTNTDQQADTVTLIIAQGATGYAVTMPSGSAYKYSGGTTTVGTTANSVTMIAITAVNIGGTTTYLTTISPEFV